jgi:alpha-N-acetylglucosaminidase
LYAAWELLVEASNEFDSDLFRYDLVDITKEILRFKFGDIYTQLMLAYNQSDLYGVRYVRRKKNFFFSYLK